MRTCWLYTGIHDRPFHYSDGAGLQSPNHAYLLTLHRHPWSPLSSFWRGYSLQTMRTCWHYTWIHDRPFHHSDGAKVSKPCIPADTTQESMKSLSSLWRGYSIQTMRTCWHYTGIHDSPVHNSDGATVSKPCVPADTTQESMTIPFIILTGLQSPNHAYLLTLHRNPWLSLSSLWRGYSLQTMRTCWHYTGIHDSPFHHSDGATVSKPCVPADTTQECMTVPFIILTELQCPNHAYLLTLHKNPWQSLSSFWRGYSLQTMRTCWHYTIIHDSPFHHSDGATVSKPCVPIKLHTNPWQSISSFWRSYSLHTMRTCWHYTGIHDSPFHHSG